MLTLSLLGPPQATLTPGPTPADLLWRKHVALLAYLVRSPQQRRTRDHLVGLLWGDKPEAAARHSLREALRVLRKALGEGIETEADQIALAPGACRVDVDDLDTHAANGDFMEGFTVPDAPPFEDWLASERVYWRSRCADALIQSVTAHLSAGRLSAARDSAIAAERLVPEREDLIRLAERLQTASAQPAGRPVPPRSTAPTPRPPLLGRDTAREDLLGAWASVASGKAVCLLIEATLGLGRSRLVEETVAHILQSDAAVAVTRLVAADLADPCAGLLAMTRPLHRVPGIAAAAPTALATLATRFPEWAARFPTATKAQPGPIAAACREIILAAVEEQPLLLAIDDAHWLDPASVAAIEQLLRDAQDNPLGVLLALGHPEGAPLGDTFKRQFGRAFPGVSVTLAPWAPEAVAALVAWGMPDASADQKERLTRRLAADSAGVPLLAVELMRAIRQGLDLGRIAQWPEPSRTLDHTLPGELPPALVAAVRIGFRQLTPPTREVAAAGAVLDDRLTPERLATATALPLATVWAATDELERQGWWVADQSGFAFVARLVREVVAQDLVTAGQRRRYRG